MWWKAKIDSSGSTADRTLKSIVLKAVGKRFVVRMNLADNTFIDADMGRVPCFHLGESVTITLYEGVHDVMVPGRGEAPPDSEG